ncbi:MAG: hypothetical protein AVDCRST_MAG93-600 [uncultured Chloroflexia bacterium]|uniref:Class I SAM-dependent methyltransferase n=1 Tax=uncultured Chloroflexia bacterium TaxID=1672391 RepID=A0A6J4HH47_9CHLR|nr:MAG: hypothetical protein AVDCRST_MAG93-600 [uncultured Chloroflexia bacterium]
MKQFFGRLSNPVKPPTSREEPNQTSLQLEQAQRQNRKLEQQLEQARRRNKKIRQKLDDTKQQLKQAKKAKLQLEGVIRDSILRRMLKGSVCAEIGVHEGSFSREILDVVQPARLHLIDPWKHEEDDRYHQSWYGGLGSEGQAIMDQRYLAVREQFDQEIRAGQVQVHRSYSDAASEEFADSYFDWIYIDGNHLYEFVKKDLKLYYPKVKTDGYITGDDYGAQNWWENGVQKAVDEFVSQRPELTLEVSGRQFVIKKSV